MTRFSSALGVSLALHGACLAALEQLPRGSQPAGQLPGHFGPGALRATLRADVAEAGREAPGTAIPAAAPLQRPDPEPARAAARSPAAAPPGVYYPAHLLDERPLVRTHVEPAFPAGAAASEGRVTIRLYIAENGRVDEIAILAADPSGMFEHAAAQAFAAAQFIPGKVGGKPVKSMTTIEVLFGSPVPLPGPHAAGAPR